MRHRYGLTPAETRLAVALLNGSSPREVAAALGDSFQTVRNQRQVLYGKTHTNRQSALVLLLAHAGCTTPGQISIKVCELVQMHHDAPLTAL